MNTDRLRSTDKLKRSLTREDVERLLEEVKSPDKLNLSKQNLKNINLAEFDLSGANLSGAYLWSANLSGANLKGAILTNAALIKANLYGAILTKADLARANLVGAILSEADLTRANMVGASLSEAVMDNVKLTEAILSGVDLNRVDLSHVNFFDVSLSEINLSGRNLNGINLSGAILSRINLSGRNLSGANLSGTNLSGANLTGSNLSGANLSGALLRGAKLTEANLRGAILRNADLTDAHLTRARLDDADFSRAKLAGAYFLGVNLSQQLKETIANSGAIGLESTVFDPEVLTSHPPVDLRSRGGSADLRTRSLDNTGPLRAMPALTPPAPSTPSSVPAPLAPVSVTTEDSTIQVRIVEEPLTSQQLTRIISVLTELHSKCWLISQGRFVAVMDYVQTGNSELVREARLVISRLQYDRVAEIDLKVYPGIKEIIGALETAITSITQTPFALKEASLNEQANRLEKELKRLGMQLVYTENSAPFTPDSFYPNNSELPKEYSTNGTEEWKGDLEKQKRLFELERERFKLQNDLERQKLELEKERLALQMERLAVEKNSLNYALQTAERMVDRLHPGVNSSIKGILSQALLPQLLQLQSLTEVEEIKVQNSPNQSESK